MKNEKVQHNQFKLKITSKLDYGRNENFMYLPNMQSFRIYAPF